MNIDHDMPATSVREIVRQSWKDMRFPDNEWLRSIGFKVASFPSFDLASILIGEYDRDGQIFERQFLRLFLHHKDISKCVPRIVWLDAQNKEIEVIEIDHAPLFCRRNVIVVGQALLIGQWRE